MQRPGTVFLCIVISVGQILKLKANALKRDGETHFRSEHIGLRRCKGNHQGPWLDSQKCLRHPDSTIAPALQDYERFVNEAMEVTVVFACRQRQTDAL